MKSERQRVVLELFRNGDGHATLDGEIYFRERRLIKQRLPSGYYQFRLNVGGERIIVLAHNLVWLVAFGTFGADKKVTFKDRDRGNFRLDNLVLVDRKFKVVRGVVRRIRHDQIESIKFYLRAGESNPSKIARELNLNRSSVFRTIKKIQGGEPLRYQDGDHVPSPKNMINLRKDETLPDTTA